MKNVLIISHCMEIGGAERALLGLLGAFDYNEYNVETVLPPSRIANVRPWLIAIG